MRVGRYCDAAAAGIREGPKPIPRMACDQCMRVDQSHRCCRHRHGRSDSCSCCSLGTNHCRHSPQPAQHSGALCVRTRKDPVPVLAYDWGLQMLHLASIQRCGWRSSSMFQGPWPGVALGSTSTRDPAMAPMRLKSSWRLGCPLRHVPGACRCQLPHLGKPRRYVLAIRESLASAPSGSMQSTQRTCPA